MTQGPNHEPENGDNVAPPVPPVAPPVPNEVPNGTPNGTPDSAVPDSFVQPTPPQPQWGQYAPPAPSQYPPAQGQYPQGAPPQPQWGQYAPPAPGQYPPVPGQYPPSGYNAGYNQYVAPPKPGVIPLRPLGLGEILDGAFQAARRNGKAMVGSALIFQMAVAIVTLLVMAVGFGPTFVKLINGSFVTDASTGEFTSTDFGTMAGQLITAAALLVVLQLVVSVAQLVFQGALVVPVARATLNRKTSFSLMWALTRPHIGALLLIGVIYAGAYAVLFGAYVGICAAFFAIGSNSSDGTIAALVLVAVLIALLFFIVALWLGIKFALTPAVLVCENRRPLDALKRSWQLSSGSWWKIFGITALAAIIAATIAGIVSVPVGLISGMVTGIMYPSGSTDDVMPVFLAQQAISGVVGALVGALTMAFQSGVGALLYVDLRMRRNGFDVTLLGEAEFPDDGDIPGINVTEPSSTSKTAPPSTPYQGP